MDLTPSIIEVRHAIQRTLHTDEASEAEGSVVTKWVMVAEVMHPNGEKMLTRLDGDAGDARLAHWDRRGLYHEALNDTGWNDT